MVVGVVMIYIWAHFFTIQFTKRWSERNWYEKILTITAIILLVLMYMGLGNTA